MAHFAKLNEHNMVTEVIVVDNANAQTEQEGKDYIASIGLDGNWIQTSYNNSFRKRYAGIGMKYYEEYDGFGQASPPYPSWSAFSVDELAFLPPVPRPNGQFWFWNEDTLSWQKS